MLALTRKIGERINIGGDVWVTVVQIRNNTVRLGIDAPRHVEIRRGELATESAVAVGGLPSIDAPPSETDAAD
ncbi:MAG: carbon storage regulator [Planctomycetia bacterium]